MNLKRHISFFLFFTLMLVKVSAFHVYSHDHDEDHDHEDCPTCKLVLESQQAVTLVPIVPHFEEENFDIIIKIDEPKIEQAHISLESHFSWFSRPPPSLI